MLDAVEPRWHAFVSLLYGAGLRLSEALALRVKDVDFARRTLVVREGKGGKDRVVMLPRPLESSLREQLAGARDLWAQDRALARPGVALPWALEAKYPKAGQTWGWFWVWPAADVSRDPRSGAVRRRHVYEQGPSRAIGRAAASAGLARRVGALGQPLGALGRGQGA